MEQLEAIEEFLSDKDVAVFREKVKNNYLIDDFVDIFREKAKKSKKRLIHQ